jgi:hypothetical protein
MSSDVPRARDILLDLADFLDEDGNGFEARLIRMIVSRFMARHFVGRFTDAKRGSLNPFLAQAIRLHADANPTMSQDEIGRVFNVAGGRVSEALAGHHWSPGRLKSLRKVGLVP